MRLNVTHVGVYQYAQRGGQTINTFHISFLVSGQVWARRVMPGGAVAELRNPKPYIIIAPPGTELEFEFDRTRENWVVMLDTDDIRYSPQTRHCEVRFEGTWVQIQQVVPVPSQWVPRWQVEFRSMLEAFHSSLPRDRLYLDLCTQNLVRYLLQKPVGLAESPAQRLKRRIDADQSCEESLEDFSAECGYSSDHLRLLFEREFRISPLSYRNQVRMTRAMDLIAASRLSVKEIAAQLGFRQMSHFSAAFRKVYGVSPREGISRFRYQR